MSVVIHSLTCDISTTMPEEDEFPMNALPHSLSRIPIQYHKCSFKLYGVKDQISHLQGFEAAFYARSCIRTSENSPFETVWKIRVGREAVLRGPPRGDAGASIGRFLKPKTHVRSPSEHFPDSFFHSLRCISQGWSDWMPAVRIELRDSSSASRATPVW
jgi:hypothetical protein